MISRQLFSSLDYSSEEQLSAVYRCFGCFSSVFTFSPIGLRENRKSKSELQIDFLFKELTYFAYERAAQLGRLRVSVLGGKEN